MCKKIRNVPWLREVELDYLNQIQFYKVIFITPISPIRVDGDSSEHAAYGLSRDKLLLANLPDEPVLPV